MENQQQFFAKMTKIDNESDETLQKLVSEEMKKLSEQIELNQQLVDKKITKIYTDIKVDKILKQLDKKISKEEALRKFENLEQIVAGIEKKEKQADGKVEKLDVRINSKKVICFSHMCKTWDQL